MTSSSRRVINFEILIILVVFMSTLGAIAPPVWGQEGKGEGGRALSAGERRELAEAEKLHEESLDLWGENPEDALPLAEKSLELRRKVLGTEHPDYAASLDNTAKICKVLGDYPRAKSLYEEALNVRKRSLGKEHPDYRESLMNLAGLYYLLEDYKQARSFFDEATKIEKRQAILEHIGKPAAWMAIRSYAAIEAALEELSSAGGGAAKSVGLVEMVNEKLGRLDGLDRARPLGVSLPVLGEAKRLGIMLSIPYSDREKIIEVVTRFFPVINEQDGILRLEGGPIPAFGRVDERDALLLLSTVEELLASPHGRLPANLFTTADDPSAMLRIDFEAAQSLQSSPLEYLEEWLLGRLQGFGVRLAGGDSYHENLFREVVSESARRLIDRLLGEFTTGDFRLWLAGEWRCELEVRARPGSTTASFLAAQDASRLRLPAMSSRDRLGGLQIGFRLSEGLRNEAGQRLAAVREWIETNPPPMEDSSAATHDARVKIAPKLLSICERLITEETIESGYELTASGGEPNLVYWLRGSTCGPDVLELTELARRGSRFPGGAAGLVPGFDRHGETSIHLIRDDDGTSGEPIYFAAEDHFLLIGLGASTQPLKTLLDLTREQGPLRPRGAPRAFLEMDLSVDGVARAGFSQTAGGDGPVAAAFRESLLQGPDTLFTTSLLATEAGFTLGARWPEPFLPALAAALRASLTARAEPSSGPSEDG